MQSEEPEGGRGKGGQVWEGGAWRAWKQQVEQSRGRWGSSAKGEAGMKHKAVNQMTMRALDAVR